ncbi:hypothetical protein SAY86_021292 [Trapa natans]|uniref:FAS1 domain-containing protein n=1 Tax=Trapa natans TaxID=22666 RepID=A0AAN7M7N9_TRANT|nr:hypothetical protein SAY86_021292 [Trapa natans]
MVYDIKLPGFQREDHTHLIKAKMSFLSNKFIGKAATMDFRALPFLVVAALLVWIPRTTAINITRLLGEYPSFSTYNDYLKQTHLDEQINKRQTITVLAVDNSNIGVLSGKPLGLIKKILCTHVVLDYYDMDKLSDMPKKSTLLTTLLQASGAARNQQGFLNITKKSSGDYFLGSAVKGAPLDSKLVQQVVVKPYNISVLQLSSPIIAPGLDGMGVNETTPITAPAASPKKTPAKSPAEAPDAEAPAAEVPAEEASAPEPSDAPADAPVNEADDEGSSKSSITRVTSVGSLLIVLGYVFLM